MNEDTPLLKILEAVSGDVTFTGCGRCGAELDTDDNGIYRPCYPCLPQTSVRRYYRSARNSQSSSSAPWWQHSSSIVLPSLCIILPISSICLKWRLYPKTKGPFSLSAGVVSAGVVSERLQGTLGNALLSSPPARCTSCRLKEMLCRSANEQRSCLHSLIYRSIISARKSKRQSYALTRRLLWQHSWLCLWLVRLLFNWPPAQSHFGTKALRNSHLHRKKTKWIKSQKAF